LVNVSRETNGSLSVKTLAIVSRETILKTNTSKALK